MEDDRVWIPMNRNGMIGHFTEMCGCGTGGDFDVLWEVLEYAMLDHEDKVSRPIFGVRGPSNSVAHELAAKVLDRAGLVEHGSSITWCVATSRGRALHSIASGLPVDDDHVDWLPAPDLSRILDEEEG